MKFQGQCKEPNCLLDSVSDGFCLQHSQDTSCGNCGFEEYEHTELGVNIKVCPSSIYEMKPDKC